MIGWPSAFSMPPCAIRTAVSAGPPGGNGTTILIGFVGKAWANAPRGSDSAARTAAEWMRTERRVVTEPSPLMAASVAPHTPGFQCPGFQSEMLPPAALCIIVAGGAYLHS